MEGRQEPTRYIHQERKGKVRHYIKKLERPSLYNKKAGKAQSPTHESQGRHSHYPMEFKQGSVRDYNGSSRDGLASTSGNEG